MILFPEFYGNYGPWGVVAGATEGLGRAYAHALAERGLNIVTIGRRSSELEKDAELLRRRYRIQVQTLVLDLAESDVAEKFSIATRDLDVGILVYNAAYWTFGDFRDAALVDHEQTIAVNCYGALALVHTMALRLKQRGRGGLVLMSSLAGFQGCGTLSTYAATKAFDTVLAEGLWAELSPHGIDVIGCAAGAMRTPKFFEVTPKAKVHKAFPMYPEEVARRVLYALPQKNKQPTMLVGFNQKLFNALTRFVPRRYCTSIFSNLNGSIYGKEIYAPIISGPADFKERYGPWAVVAGASEGIGLAYANQLAEKGLSLILIARRADKLEIEAEAIRQRYPVQVKTLAMDLSAPHVALEFDAATKNLDIGLLVYNACYSRIAPFVEIPLVEHQQMVSVNCLTPVSLLSSLVPRLVARGGGGILLMSSMSGLQGSAMVTTYAATKAFNTAFAESLWIELKPYGVDVLACIAGATLTPGFEKNTPKDKWRKVFPMEAGDVAFAGIQALPHGHVYIVGRVNKLVNAFSNLMTRRQRTYFFSKSTIGVYGDK